MKSEILVCLYAYFPFANANTNVMLPLIKRFTKDYIVNILTLNNENKAAEFEAVDGINIYRFKQQNVIVRGVQSLSTINHKKKRNLIKRTIVKIVKPIALQLMKLGVFDSSELRMLEDLMSKKKFAFILSTCESFYSHLNVLNFSKRHILETPWVAYYMDPFAYYIGNLKNNDYLVNMELEVYEKSSIVMVTEEIYEENRTNKLSKYLNKTYPVKYGNFKLNNSCLTRPIFIEGKINIVYVGSLIDSRIRSPEYLYNLMNRLDNRYIFHMICSYFSRENDLMRDRLLTATEKVIWYYRLPLEECMGIMNHADILLNIGNKSINQTPSKVFDYIGTGRPIINLYSIEGDTSMKYLDNYPNKINIFEDVDLIGDNVRKINAFVSEHLGYRVEEEHLLELYKEYLSERVVENTYQEIVNNLNELLPVIKVKN